MNPCCYGGSIHVLIIAGRTKIDTAISQLPGPVKSFVKLLLTDACYVSLCCKITTCHDEGRVLHVCSWHCSLFSCAWPYITAQIVRTYFRRPCFLTKQNLKRYRMHALEFWCTYTMLIYIRIYMYIYFLFQSFPSAFHRSLSLTRSTSPKTSA